MHRIESLAKDDPQMYGASIVSGYELKNQEDVSATSSALNKNLLAKYVYAE